MHGLVVAGANNYIWSYELKDQKEVKLNDLPTYYTLLHSKIGTDEKNDIGKDANNTNQDSITSLAISLTEEYIFVVTKQNQLQTVKYSHDKYQSDQPKFKFVHTEFHSQPITGMDVCLRK